MKTAILTLFSLSVGIASDSFASSAQLASGHWFTCWGGGAEQLRRDPPFHKNTPENEVAAYIPQFAGAYGFEVKDTWEEWVTHSGNNCGRCGSTNQTDAKGNVVSSSCNYCSWQELETFYRHWSNQQTDWRVTWNQDQNYRKRRQSWIKNGMPEIAQDASQLGKLNAFDPDRPLEYFLFPGEVEHVRVSNDSGRSISPGVSIGDARHNYSIDTVVNGSRSDRRCEDENLKMDTLVKTLGRKVTTTPNSLEFREGWISTKLWGDATMTEPSQFKVVDLSAQRYEGQNVMDHYKDSDVQINIREINRSWWIDYFIGTGITEKDLHGELTADARTNSGPDVAEYSFNAHDMMKTPWFGYDFHLHPGTSYQVCGRVSRSNNVYYDSKTWYGGKAWSEWNCAQFKYSGSDLRSFGRKTADVLDQINPLAIYFWF